MLDALDAKQSKDSSSVGVDQQCCSVGSNSEDIKRSHLLLSIFDNIDHRLVLLYIISNVIKMSQLYVRIFHNS